MENRKEPTPVPTNQVRPEPPPVPPVGRLVKTDVAQFTLEAGDVLVVYKALAERHGVVLSSELTAPVLSDDVRCMFFTGVRAACVISQEL